VIENWEGRGLGAENEDSVNAGARGELANADSVGCANACSGMGTAGWQRDRIRLFSVVTLQLVGFSYPQFVI
jgi:hypothetical protein